MKGLGVGRRPPQHKWPHNRSRSALARIRRWFAKYFFRKKEVKQLAPPSPVPVPENTSSTGLTFCDWNTRDYKAYGKYLEDKRHGAPEDVLKSHRDNLLPNKDRFLGGMSDQLREVRRSVGPTMWIDKKKKYFYCDASDPTYVPSGMNKKGRKSLYYYHDLHDNCDWCQYWKQHAVTREDKETNMH